MKHLRWADFCVVRSALLPVEFELGAEGTTLAETAAALLSDSLVRRVVRTASPSILAAHDDPKRSTPSAHNALVRYVERMRGRATPFALLAGYSVVRADLPADRGVRLAARENYRHRVRLDLDAVCTIVRDDAVERFTEVRWKVKRDVVRFRDVVRVVKRNADESLSYDDVARTAALDAVMAFAREPRTVAELVAKVPGHHAEASKLAFVKRMVDAEILVPEHSPALLTHDERTPLTHVRNAGELAEASTAVRDMALGSPIDERLHRLDEVLASRLPSGMGSRVIHDLVKPVEASGLRTAGADAELRKVVSLLSSLTVRRQDARLETFLIDFDERYEGREIRLVDALDEDRGYNFPPPATTAADTQAKQWTAARERWRQRAHDPSIRSVELTDADVKRLSRAPVSFPSGGLLCSLAIDERGELEIWSPVLFGPPATHMFARGTGADKALYESTRRWLFEAANSESSDVEAVDVAYFIIGKAAAISQYPPLLPYELTLTAATDAETSIDVNDLLLSTSGKEFVLRNARTGRRVVLRGTNAVNYSQADTTSLVRFLDALQASNAPVASMVWPEDRSIPFSPRLQWKQHVLAPAQWSIEGPTVDRLLAAGPGDVLEAAARLRAEHHLPRHVLYLESHDHWLHVDLECPLSVGAWLDIAKVPLLLRERFPAERSAVHGPEGHFVHEVVFPFLGAPAPETTTKTTPAAARPIEPSIADAVPPGGEWLYVEILGSRQELLPLACEVAENVLEPLLRERVIERWFYLPYADSEARLRVRAKGNAQTLLGKVYPALRTALGPAFMKGLVRDIAIRTYDRETYRYGGPFGMDLTEAVWTQSSIEAVARHADLDDVFEMAEEELVLELVGIHRWLLDHALDDAAAKRDVAAAAFHGYARTETPLDLRRAGADLHRKLRDRLPAQTSVHNDELRSTFATIRAGVERGTITESLSSLLADYLHTQTFRLVSAWHSNVKLEPLAYVVLEKIYASEAARKR